MDQETLYHFFNGDATFQQEMRVIAWLDENPDHRKELIKERKIFDATLLLADEKRMQNKNRSILFLGWIKEVAKIAAVLLISFGIGWNYISREQNKLLALTNTISVPLGQRVNLTLSDGTKVCLNALSELQYPTFFAGKERKVKLKGEAFFDVIHNAEQPFVVETNKYNVEVLGTAFDVQAYPNTDKFLTSLLRGKVRIVNNKIPGQTITLNPNEQAYFANKKLIVRQIPDLDVFNWRDGLLCFKQSSFQTLMHRFEECYDVQIIIRKYPSLENEFTGKMRISDGLDHAIRVLQMNTQFTYRWDEKMRIIYIE